MDARTQFSRKVTLIVFFRLIFPFHLIRVVLPFNSKNSSIDGYSFEWFLNDELVSNKRNPVLPFNPDLDDNQVMLLINRQSKCEDSMIQNVFFNYAPSDSIFRAQIFSPLMMIHSIRSGLCKG